MGNEIANSNQSQLSAQNPYRPKAVEVRNIFANAEAFGFAVRQAQYLSASTLVPKDYQRNEGNCLIAIDMANRQNVNPLMVMQNLYIVNGRPAWSSQWIIAMINNSHKYKTELQFEFGNAPEDGGLSCTAWVEDWNGHRVTGPKITMKMAESEGWSTKNMSKWKTMPQVMIQYRAASFFGRMNCPDMVMGLYTTDEVKEFTDGEPPYMVDKATGEVIVVSDDSKTNSGSDEIVTAADRQKLFALAKTAWGDDANKELKEIISAMGYTSTGKMKKSDFTVVYEKVSDIIEASKEEQEEYDGVVDGVAEELNDTDTEPEDAEKEEVVVIDADSDISAMFK